MKGVINIEFFLSVAVFISTIFFLILNIANSIPQFHNEAFLSSIRATAFDVSQIVLLDEGSPKNWAVLPLIQMVNRFGLSTSEKYVLSEAKIIRLATFCATDYNSVRNIIVGDPNLIVIINITNIETNNNILYCSPTAASLVFPKSSVKRYAVLDTNRNRISIQVDVT